MVRQLLHGVVAVLLWVVFVYYWWIVLRRPMNPDTKTAIITLSVLTSVSILCLAAWIFHNIRIHRRLHRRKQRRRMDVEISRDYLGRPIVIDDPYLLRRSNYVEVEVIRSYVSGRTVERKIIRARAEMG
jgi:hypothetical protein